jgi:hypothetical protein
LAREQIDEFLKASTEIDFTGQGRSQVYAWIAATLVEQEYFTLARAGELMAAGEWPRT